MEPFQEPASSFVPEAEESDLSCSQFAPQRAGKKLHRIRKNAARTEKKSKGRTGRPRKNQSSLHRLPTKKDQQDAETQSSDSVKDKLMLMQEKSHSPFLHRLLLKPPYLLLTGQKQLTGNLGHATAILRRPLVEGTYFLEFLMKENAPVGRKLANRGSIRVGICQYEHNPAFPLGYGHSYGYKAKDGSIVHNGDRISRAEQYLNNDIITIVAEISPPRKHPEPDQVNPGSCVYFLKNGRLMHKIGNLKQTLYCFGVSLYNYGQVQILEGPQSLKPLPDHLKQAKHYYSALNQPVLYKDLSQLKCFKAKPRE